MYFLSLHITYYDDLYILLLSYQRWQYIYRAFHVKSTRAWPDTFALYNFSRKKNDLTEIFGKIHKITILDDKIFQLLAEVEKWCFFVSFHITCYNDLNMLLLLYQRWQYIYGAFHVNSTRAWPDFFLTFLQCFEKIKKRPDWKIWKNSQNHYIRWLHFSAIGGSGKIMLFFIVSYNLLQWPQYIIIIVSARIIHILGIPCQLDQSLAWFFFQIFFNVLRMFWKNKKTAWLKNLEKFTKSLHYMTTFFSYWRKWKKMLFFIVSYNLLQWPIYIIIIGSAMTIHIWGIPCQLDQGLTWFF